MKSDEMGNKIRLLQFVNTLDFGGATDYALTLCENIDKEAYEVRLATGPGDAWKERAGICNDDVLVLDTMKPTHTQESGNSLFGDVVAVYRLYSYLKLNEIQVIHSHGSKSRLIGGIASWLARTPVRIQSAHGFAFNSEMPGWKFLIFMQLERLMGRLYQQLVLESENDLNEARNHRLSRNSCCIYTGIIEPFQPATNVIQALRESIGIPETGVMVLMVGRLAEQKDPHTFVKTALLVNERCSSTYFVVVGDGDLLESTKKIVNGAERIVLLGTRTDVTELISACDIYMLTSRWEGIPITILIAMALQKPVVATNKLGLPEVVVDGETGMLSEEGQPVSYGSAVLKLVENSTLRTDLGSNGQGLLNRRHRMDIMMSNFEKLYSK